MKPTDIKTLREKLGFTQTEFAAFLRLSEKHGLRTIRDWEKGNRNVPGPVTLTFDLLSANLKGLGKI